MAGGPSIYHILGFNVPSRYLAIGSLAAWGGLLYVATSGSKDKDASMAQQMKSMDDDEAKYIKQIMDEVNKEEAKVSKKH